MRQVLTLVYLAAVVACGRPISKTIPGEVSTSSSGVALGGEVEGGKRLIAAYLVGVNTECLPHTQRIGKGEKVAGAEFLYDVAATANVTYTINDQKTYERAVMFAGAPSATIRFDILAESGVVIGSSTESVGFVLNNTSVVVSSKIKGLSEYEIRRASRVVVSWQYGR